MQKMVVPQVNIHYNREQIMLEKPCSLQVHQLLLQQQCKEMALLLFLLIFKFIWKNYDTEKKNAFEQEIYHRFQSEMLFLTFNIILDMI